MFLKDAVKSRFHRVWYHPRINKIRIRRGRQRRCAELRKRMADVEQSYTARREAAKTTEENREIDFEILDDIRDYQGELFHLERELKIEPLLERADRLGVEIPKEWFDETGNRFGLRWEYRPRVQRQVREARLRFWKNVSEIVVPILALVVAILALFRP
jgi:hypothetical protein